MQDPHGVFSDVARTPQITSKGLCVDIHWEALINKYINNQ